MHIIKRIFCAVAVLAIVAFVACENDDSGEKPYGIFFTYDGEKYALKEGVDNLDYDVNPFGHQVDGSATEIGATSDCAATLDAADDLFICICSGIAAGETAYPADFWIKIDGVNSEIDSLTVTFKSYGEIGEDITGSVEGFDDTTSVLTGTFKVHRIADVVP